MKSAEIKNGKVVNIILGCMDGHVPVDDGVVIGDCYDGLCFYKQPPDIPGLKASKSERINRDWKNSNKATFVYAGQKIACDDDSRAAMDVLAGVIAMTGDFPAAFSRMWKTQNNTQISMPDIASFQSMYAAMAEHVSNNFKQAQTLKAALELAESATEIEAINWPTPA
ncbi:DUF4376 domain-containing protein [Undibacterium sp. CY18W]|uniref:DUF4376 domain-containing protein n=1 Tax=Undibacterium hunanense TaxID=2762292 RepID=A0ABR6ZTI4_9BURK|nr:DUF4376 domain-containing protein [Undibacterium hunanense]MBC3919157.1 DUF4376 domain-containing protein [Undibacterium hunanense]